MIDWSKTSWTFRLVLMALMVALLVAVDEALAFIPFLQLVTFTIVMCYCVFGYKFTIVVLFIYVTLDCLISGGMWPLFVSIPVMFVAWLFLPTLLNFSKLVKGSIFKKLWVIVPITAIHGFIYGQTFAVVTTLIYNSDTWDLFYRGWLGWTMADIPWEVAQCIVGAVTVGLMLPPVYMAAEKALRRYSVNHPNNNEKLIDE
ncbi:MAG: hypothetical protein K5923_06495 [Clostridia bacterium]|nr:hypothetical protein [Clostridia bacterium]